MAEDLDSLALAKDIIRAVSQPFSFGGFQLQVGASVGISRLKPGSNASSTMLREADIALYAAKQNGKARAVVFSTGEAIAA